MDGGLVKKDAEALRYRLIVRLALVAREAKSQGRTDVVEFAQMLRKEIEAIEVPAGEAEALAAKNALIDQMPKIEKLQEAIGLPDHGMVVYPKWLRFAAWTSPVLIGFGALGWIIERRRKKKEVSAADIQQLERTIT